MIRGSVGTTGTNDKGDVAVVQAYLRLLKHGNSPFLNGTIDGVFGKKTKAAISAFQACHSPTNRSAQGSIKLGDGTVAAIERVSLAKLGRLRSLPGIAVVYKEASTSSVANSKRQISNLELDASFKLLVIQLVERMHRSHGLTLGVTRDGGRRSFQDQADIKFSATSAGPGESNHQWGHAVDLGFAGLEFYDRSAKLHKDNWWLSRLQRTGHRNAMGFWDARNKIATNIGIDNIGANDLIHLRSRTSGSANGARSLIALLDKQSKWSWSRTHVKKTIGSNTFNTFNCDLGGHTKVDVGNTREIWAGKATVTKAKLLASGWKKAGPATGGPALGAIASASSTASITDADVADVKQRLQKILISADADWKSWTPVP